MPQLITTFTKLPLWQLAPISSQGMMLLGGTALLKWVWLYWTSESL